MPEGPEVKTLATSIAAELLSEPHNLVNCAILSGRYFPPKAPPSNYFEFDESLHPDFETGDVPPPSKPLATSPPPLPSPSHPSNRITAWNCRGKFQYLALPSSRSVWITLGMSGRFLWNATDHRHARFNFVVENAASKERRDLTFVDARQFGTVKMCMDDGELEKKLGSLGPDILDDRVTDGEFIEAVNKQRLGMNVCKWLMNQQKICGVGNYILAEGLYKAAVDPWANIKDLPEPVLVQLFAALRTTARQSYAAQGATLMKNGTYRQIDGTTGNFEFSLECYGKREAPSGEPVLKIVDGPHKRAIHFVWEQVGEENREMVRGLLEAAKRR